MICATEKSHYNGQCQWLATVLVYLADPDLLIKDAKLLHTDPSLLTKSRNKHALEIEVQPLHIIFRSHHIDFS